MGTKYTRAMPRRLAAVLALLLVASGNCSALRSLQQSGAAAQALTAQGPVAPAKSNIQLNAPGTSNLLNAPALAPASGPLPAGVVSLAAKRNSNDAGDGQTLAYTTVPVRHPGPQLLT